MSQRPLRCVAVLGVIGAVVLAAAGPATATTTWRIQVRLTSSASTPYVGVNDVATASSKSVWAVGSESVDKGYAHRALVEHWNGKKWSRVAAPSAPAGSRGGASLSGVIAGPHGVWVVGSAAFGSSLTQGDFVARWTGKTWVDHSFGANWTVAHVAVLSSTDVRILGERTVLDQDAIPTELGATAQWNGHVWSTGSLTALPNLETNSAVSQEAPLWAPATTGAYPGKPTLLHWNGHAWTAASLPKLTLPKGATAAVLDGVLDRGHDNLWLGVSYTEGEQSAADVTLFHLTSSGWHHTLTVEGDDTEDIISDGGSGLWVRVSGPNHDLLHVTDDGTKVAARVVPPTRGKAIMGLAGISLLGHSVIACGGFLAAPQNTDIAELTI